MLDSLAPLVPREESRQRRPLARARGAVRLENAQVIKPSARVELRVHRLDLVRLRGIAPIIPRLQQHDTRDVLLDRGGTWAGVGLGRTPAEGDVVAAVPHVKDVEGDVGLAALAGFEGCLAGEGRGVDVVGAVGAAAVYCIC